MALNESSLSLGERLEEARKRKGVSIREASEATKVRGDFLLSMEEDNFDLRLPDLYERGFLKIYAQYLKLDTEKIMTDYEARQMALKGGTPRRPNDHRPGQGDREVLGRFDLPGEREQEPAPKRPSGRPRSPMEPADEDHHGAGSDHLIYYKIGLGIAGLVIVGVIVFALINLLRSGDDEMAAGPAAGTPIVSSNTTTPPPRDAPPNTGPEEVFFVARDSVTIIVEEVDTGERLYAGTILAGESISVEKRGPLLVRYTNGQALQIERNGQTFEVERDGAGLTRIP